MTSSLRCSERFSEFFFAWYSAWCMCTFSSTLVPLHRTTCTEKHSICELLRRIPSLSLAPSVELAFAAHCMHGLPPCRTRGGARDGTAKGLTDPFS